MKKFIGTGSQHEIDQAVQVFVNKAVKYLEGALKSSSGIEQARSEAIRRNTTIRFDRNGSGWNVVLPASGGVPDTVLASRAARQTQVTLTADVDTISFSGSGWTSPGRCSSASGSATCCRATCRG